MVLNPAILSCKSAHILHFGSQTRIPTKPFQISAVRRTSISKYRTSYGFSVLGPLSRIGLRKIGSYCFRVSAVTGGGTGGGYTGGFGDGSSGKGDGGGGGDSEKKWSLISWYLYLSKLVTTPGVSGAFLRLLFFAPAFVGVFLSTLLTLEGRPSLVMPKLQQEWFSTVIANWKLWIPFQFLNFLFVPQQFQVLAANSLALIWNVILSYIAHKEVIV